MFSKPQNEDEIERAVRLRMQQGKALRFILALEQQENQHSDGLTARERRKMKRQAAGVSEGTTLNRSFIPLHVILV